MQDIVGPIAVFMKWTFDNVLVPIGELPATLNPNSIFIIVIVLGLVYWLFLQIKFNKKARRDGGLE